MFYLLKCNLRILKILKGYKVSQEKPIIKLMNFSRNTYYVWKREGRPIISLLEKYFTKEELEEFLQTGKISALEQYRINVKFENEIFDSLLMRTVCRASLSIPAFLHVFILPFQNYAIVNNLLIDKKLFVIFLHNNFEALVNEHNKYLHILSSIDNQEMKDKVFTGVLKLMDELSEREFIYLVDNAQYVYENCMYDFATREMNPLN